MAQRNSLESLEERVQRALSQSAVTLATSNTHTLDAFAELYQLPAEVITGHDPEYVLDPTERRPEPTSDAVTAVLFKLLQLVQYYQYVNNFQIHRRRLNRRAEKKQPYYIAAGDVGFAYQHLSGEPRECFKAARDARQGGLSESELAAFQIELKKRYTQPFIAHWEFSPGIVYRSSIRAGLLGVSTFFPEGISEEYIDNSANVAPKTNPGIDLVKIATEQQQEFVIFDKAHHVFTGQGIPLRALPPRPTEVITRDHDLVHSLLVQKVLPPWMMHSLLFPSLDEAGMWVRNEEFGPYYHVVFDFIADLANHSQGVEV